MKATEFVKTTETLKDEIRALEQEIKLLNIRLEVLKNASIKSESMIAEIKSFEEQLLAKKEQLEEAKKELAPRNRKIIRFGIVAYILAGVALSCLLYFNSADYSTTALSFAFYIFGGIGLLSFLSMSGVLSEKTNEKLGLYYGLSNSDNTGLKFSDVQAPTGSMSDLLGSTYTVSHYHSQEYYRNQWQ